MGAGRILGAGSRWAGALPARLPPEHFLYQAKCDCLFTNGTERVRFLERYIWDRQQIAHFDSDVGRFVADTELGRRSAEHWNGDQEIVAEKRAAADTFCRYNYPVLQAGQVLGRTVPPKVKVSPTQSGSQPHSHQLVCSVTGFYPGGIEIKWLKNGQEQTAGVVSTELLHNGDWTFQILLMLEMSPRRGDVYTCQVEHVSLRDPITAQSDSARSKMLTGVGGFVLGLIFLAPGLLIYLKNKKGEWLRAGADPRAAPRGRGSWVLPSIAWPCGCRAESLGAPGAWQRKSLVPPARPTARG
uniref:Ig-like domain-containing protein n=1 Tax=Chelydra serpentina TaxID=8475 RepID=A0A8C3S2U6_CHESE